MKVQMAGSWIYQANTLVLDEGPRTFQLNQLRNLSRTATQGYHFQNLGICVEAMWSAEGKGGDQSTTARHEAKIQKIGRIHGPLKLSGAT